MNGSRNGSRSSRFESFGTGFLFPSAVSAFNSTGKAFFCSALIVTWLACSSSAADGGKRSLLGVFECFLSWNPFINQIRLATACFMDNQLERCLNPAQILRYLQLCGANNYFSFHFRVIFVE